MKNHLRKAKILMLNDSLQNLKTKTESSRWHFLCFKKIAGMNRD